MSKTVFDTIQDDNDLGLGIRGAFTLGSNVALLWERYWQNEDGFSRRELAYQVRDPLGQLVKATTLFSPPLLPDSVNQNDEYSIGWKLSDTEGKLWISYLHERTGQYYYIILVLQRYEANA